MYERGRTEWLSGSSGSCAAPNFLARALLGSDRMRDKLGGSVSQVVFGETFFSRLRRRLCQSYEQVWTWAFTADALMRWLDTQL